MRIDVLTLFPEMFKSPLSCSILKRAQDAGLVNIILTNIRDFASDSYSKVDDKPYGGGPGMVMMPGPVFDCVEHVEKLSPDRPRIILLTPQGRKFDQQKAVELSKEKRLILIAGKYEGFDERIRIGLEAEQISIGDYVLSGGEIPALVVVDAVSRLIPGVIGNESCLATDSFCRARLGAPQYTRPRSFRGMTVPDVLLSGDHGMIEQWRLKEAFKKTLRRRPDLVQRGDLEVGEIATLEQAKAELDAEQ